LPSTQVIDQNVAHELCGQSIELSAAVQGKLVLARKPQPYLMHKNGGLQDRLGGPALQGGTPNAA